jgi:hypothetical protein
MGLYLEVEGDSKHKDTTLLATGKVTSVAMPVEYYYHEEICWLAIAKNITFDAVLVVAEPHDFGRVMADVSGRRILWFETNRAWLREQLILQGVTEEKLKRAGL